jgi:hypothetical protein
MAGITTEYRVNAGCVTIESGEWHIQNWIQKMEHCDCVRHSYTVGITWIYIEEDRSEVLVKFFRDSIGDDINVTIWIGLDRIRATCRKWEIKNDIYVCAEFLGRRTE